MKALLLACLVLVASVSPTLAAGSCLLSLRGHEHPSGASYKICWYECLGGEVSVTVSATRPCPFKIDAPDRRARSPRLIGRPDM